MTGSQGRKEEKRLLRVSVLIEWGKPEPGMRIEQVEIYSDAANAAIMRHPGRRFPGVLVQGDSLSILCRTADELCTKARPVLDSESYIDLAYLRNHLCDLLMHYRSVLQEHKLELPFSEDHIFSQIPLE